MHLSEGGRVLAQPLCSRLADIQRGTDSAYRGNTVSCQVGRGPGRGRRPRPALQGCLGRAATAPARIRGHRAALSPASSLNSHKSDRPPLGVQAPRPAGLAMCPHQSARVLVRHNRSDHCDAKYSQRRRPPNNPIGHLCRTPLTSENSTASKHGLFGDDGPD